MWKDLKILDGRSLESVTMMPYDLGTVGYLIQVGGDYMRVPGLSYFRPYEWRKRGGQRQDRNSLQVLWCTHLLYFLAHWAMALLKCRNSAVVGVPSQAQRVAKQTVSSSVAVSLAVTRWVPVFLHHSTASKVIAVRILFH